MSKFVYKITWRRKKTHGGFVIVETTVESDRELNSLKEVVKLTDRRVDMRTARYERVTDG